MRRAIAIRIAALVAEQAATKAAIELGGPTYERSAPLQEMRERQERLRGFRELALNSGEPDSGTWLPQAGEGSE